MTFTYDENLIQKRPEAFKYEPSGPTIDTLIPDILQYMGGRGTYPKLNDNAAEELCKIMSNIVVERLKERRNQIDNHNNDGEYKLRMSNYGQPLRKLWYEANVGTDLGATDPRAFLNFLIGDVWEAILLFIAKQTGHEVTMEQETVDLDGMKGHMDAVVDGVLVDVKSASKYSFERKFLSGAILKGEDPFAYVPQLRGYGEAAGIQKQAWLVGNKENGELALVELPEDKSFSAKAILDKAREAIKLKEPPKEKCFEPEPYGKSGNMQLNGNCRFCAFKEACWKDDGLRAFKYASGPVYLTKVVNEPNVEEIDLYGKYEEDNFYDE
jgi:CRISPR/Cas system-associated exonuclease Cas4 (RecB family)